MARVILVGGGKMGGALLAGWLRDGVCAPDDVTVVEPDAGTGDAVKQEHGVEVVPEPGEGLLSTKPAITVFAVKPQVMDVAAPAYRGLAGQSVFLSIAAGKTIGFFEAILGERAAVVRAMPNTPAAVGRGITVACANALVTDPQKELCSRMLAAVGDVDWVADESLIDAVTAVSGSGPAYVFLLTECMTEAGIEAGLDPELAARLARATVAGSGELMRQSPDDAATLRKNVTSPGGTTAAALAVLMKDDAMAALMSRAIAAAAARSRELAS